MLDFEQITSPARNVLGFFVEGCELMDGRERARRGCGSVHDFCICAENRLKNFQRRRGLEAPREDDITRHAKAFIDPARHKAPEIGASNPALGAAAFAKFLAPTIKAGGVFVLLPQFGISGYVPFGDESMGLRSETGSGMHVEKIRVIGMNDAFPKHELLNGR